MKSASPDRLREDVVVLAVVVSELKLRNVEREVLLAHLVERADHAALHQRPEAFNGLSYYAMKLPPNCPAKQKPRSCRL